MKVVILILALILITHRIVLQMAVYRIRVPVLTWITRIILILGPPALTQVARLILTLGPPALTQVTRLILALVSQELTQVVRLILTLVSQVQTQEAQQILILDLPLIAQQIQLNRANLRHLHKIQIVAIKPLLIKILLKIPNRLLGKKANVICKN
jgi:hypothetical protein